MEVLNRISREQKRPVFYASLKDLGQGEDVLPKMKAQLMGGIEGGNAARLK